MTHPEIGKWKGDQHYWDTALQTHKDKVVPAIEKLLQSLHPHRGQSVELNQLIQELTFLQSSLSLDLKLPKDWHVWLFRGVRSSALDKIPEAKELARDLVITLSPSTAQDGNVVDAVPAFAWAGAGHPAGETPTDVKYFLRLFVSGTTRPSQKAVENLKKLSEQLGNCEFEIVDILANPGLAETERIVATPTLLREYPLPRRKIIGDLSDTDTVLLILSA